ncbi:hypothetical protein V6N13_037960 [Hibiscus sabdariffa]
MWPVKLFPPRKSPDKMVKFPMEAGIEPEFELSAKDSKLRDLSIPISRGKGPEKAFSSSIRLNKLVKWDTPREVIEGQVKEDEFGKVSNVPGNVPIQCVVSKLKPNQVREVKEAEIVKCTSQGYAGDASGAVASDSDPVAMVASHPQR